MRGDRFVPRLIQFVLALGVLSAVLTVGEDVLDAPDETSVASSGQGAPEGPLPEAPTIVPPQNSSNESDTAALRVCAASCEPFLL